MMTPPLLLRGKGAALGPCALRYPFEKRTMVQLLADRAAQSPDRTWLIFDGVEHLTYGRAQQMVDRVAKAVRADLPTAAHVGLLLRNQIEFMPALYGSMAGGCVAVPFNSEVHGSLLGRLIEDSDVEILIVTPEHLDTLSALSDLGQVRRIIVCGGAATAVPGTVNGIAVTDWGEWLAAAPDSEPRPLPHAADTALIQFTSGTTGRSKGVVLPHHFLFLCSAIQADSQERTADDVLSTPLPLFHAAALHHVAGSALQVGCTGHLKSKFSASRFWDQIADDGATFAILIGSMASILMKATTPAPEHSLAAIMCVPPPPEIELFEERFRTKVLWQGYGMTEISSNPMAARMEPGLPRTAVGHPVDWMDYGVVDEFDIPVPTDEIGQLVLRPLVPYAMASGYYKNPEATTLAFRNLMFHTGDLAKLDDAGRVHYLGRGADRIRRRGENVSAEELETIAAGHPAVLECAAYGVPGEFGEHDIKMDVVLRGELSLDELHGWLTERLPRFMVPRYLERRDALPKTPTQKVEKRVMAAESLDRPEVRDFPSAPRASRVR